MIGGLLNATLGNLTELLIALAALRAGQYVLVKASIAGAIVTNALFMLGASFLLGGLKHHVQEFNRNNARVQAGLLFPGDGSAAGSIGGRGCRCDGTTEFTQTLSLGLSVLLIVTYGLGLLFTSRHMPNSSPAPTTRVRGGTMAIGPFLGDAGGCHGACGPCQ
jgi:Ca2+:H+ antiporter